MADGEKLVLKPGVVTPFLSNFAMSNDGESFHFTVLDMSNRNIESLNKAIEEAKEVYTCDLSGNNIADPSALKELSNLMKLDLARNKVKNINIFCMEETFMNLKYLDLQNNKLTELPNFTMPKLEYLDISFNKLEKINDAWAGHPSLKVLKSIDNKFKSMAPFKNMPKLEELYLANNNLASLAGYGELPALKILHVRHNKIEKIEEEGVGELPALEYLNLRTNKIADLENLFRLFTIYPALKKMNFLNCPIELSYSSMNMFLADVLAKKPDTKRFCKVEITDKHKLEAVYLAKYKWEKEEAARKAKEEAERIAAEAEGEG
jgi:hypothetical protein